MSVETTLNRKAYTGDGSTTAFPTTFQFLDATDLVVIERVIATGVETVKTITTDYTVSGGDGEVGTVTMLVAPASTKKLTIYNDPAITQSVDLVEGDVSPAETKERGYDRLTYIAQRLADRVDRSVHLSEGFTSTFDTTLPAQLTVDCALIINSAGDGLDIGPTASDIADAQTNAAAAAASAAAALVSEGAASTSATAAAASAAAAAAAAAFGSWTYVAKTTTYAALVTDRVIEGNPTGGTFSVTLPTAVGNQGLIFVVKHNPVDVSGNVLNLATTSAQTIDGAASPYAITEPGQFVMVISDNANWKIINAG